MAAPPPRPHILPRQTSNSFWSRPTSSTNTNDWGWTDDLDDDTWDSTSDQEDAGRPSKKGFSNRIGSGLKVKKTPSKDQSIDASPVASSEDTPSSSTIITSTTASFVGTATNPIPLTNGRPSANARQMTSGGRNPSFGANSSIDQGSTSSGNVSFSFTHLDAPSPSSYPLREPVLPSLSTRQPTLLPQAGTTPSTSSKSGDEADVRRAAGWTIVSRDEAAANRLARDRRLRNGSGGGGGRGLAIEESDFGEPVVHLNEDDETPRAGGERDVDGEMVLGDLELEDRAPSQKRVGAGSEAITLYVEDIVKDPMFPVRQSAEFRQTAAAALSPPLASSAFGNLNSSTSGAAQAKEKSDRKQERFEDCLLKEDVDMTTLRKYAWSGIPSSLRPIAWPLLLGYLPLSSAARMAALTRKRSEYQRLVDVTFSRGKDGLDQQIWHQIEIDVPRTRPGVRLWMMEGTQRSLERILYVWAIRHPASGYVQGINDLVTPFYEVFLSAYVDSDPEDFDPAFLPPHVLTAVEADSFWCLSRLLDGIQDNYIQAQPGIQRSVKRMRELVGRIDPALAAHLDAQGVEFIQFAFRWMNCLLMREISVKNTIRMWDTYLSEGTDAFSQFHLYVCCAFLVQWGDKLKEMDFQGVIMFLQSLPTENWTEHEIEMLLSQAFVLSNTWANAQSHFS